MRSKDGFTLIELLVVMAIIGVLAATAIPAYEAYRKHSFEAVAITYMRHWVTAQEAFMQRYGHYADSDDQLENPMNILVKPHKIPYTFQIDSTAFEHWTGHGTPDITDLHYLYIDETGRLVTSVTPLP